VTSNCSDESRRRDLTAGAVAPKRSIEVALLKSGDFAGWQARHGQGWQLPYRLDHLEEYGLRLNWTDALHAPRWQRSRAAPVVARAEQAGVPFAQAALMGRTIAAAPITLAMFESEANAVAAVRRVLPGRQSSVLAVVSCWLAEVLAGAGWRRRAGYRWAYRSVDRLYYFSENQGPMLAEQLGFGPDRLRYVPFGVDDETFIPGEDGDDGYLLVVGRDRGRDWPTLLAAVDGIGLPVKLCCRPADLRGERVPREVEVLGYVDREVYRALLSRARVVVIATRPVVYPSGQSVLLEAMAAARAVVVTRTPALEGYIDDGVTALAVPPGERDALRTRILEAAADDELRRRLGQGGRAAVERSFNARAMWAAVAQDLLAAGGWL
jgi:glycosyltransferase involved in cell wall biosynthesis